MNVWINRYYKKCYGWKNQLGFFLFLMFFFFVLVPASQGQFGIKVGTSISNFSYVDTGPIPNLGFDIDLRQHLGYEIEWIQLGDQKPLITPYIGIYWSYKIVNRLKLITELSFMQKGVNFSQSEYEKITYKVKISYLEIPVLLSYSFIQKPKFVSELQSGLYGSLSLDARKIIEIYDSERSVSSLENARKIVSGFLFGLNFKYRIKEDFVLLNVRGFIDINDALLIPDDQVNIYHQIQKIKNVGTYITLGYEF